MEIKLRKFCLVLGLFTCVIADRDFIFEEDDMGTNHIDARAVPTGQAGSPSQSNFPPREAQTPLQIYAFNTCFHKCKAPETYNPVCGSDGVTYFNRDSIPCANNCGKSVTFVSMGSCAQQENNNQNGGSGTRGNSETGNSRGTFASSGIQTSKSLKKTTSFLNKIVTSNDAKSTSKGTLFAKAVQTSKGLKKSTGTGSKLSSKKVLSNDMKAKKVVKKAKKT